MSPETRPSRVIAPQTERMSPDQARIIRMSTPASGGVNDILKLWTNNDRDLHALFSDPVNAEATLIYAQGMEKLVNGDQNAVRRTRRRLRNQLPVGRMKELKPLFTLVRRIYRPGGYGRGWARHIRREKSLVKK